MSIFHQIGKPYEGPPPPLETAECVAAVWLPNVYGEFRERWEEANVEQRRGYVEARRRCNCPGCRRWRREHNVARRRGGLPESRR